MAQTAAFQRCQEPFSIARRTQEIGGFEEAVKVVRGDHGGACAVTPVNNDDSLSDKKVWLEAAPTYLTQEKSEGRNKC